MFSSFLEKEPSTKTQLIIVSIISSGIVLFFYHKIIFNLNDSLFGIVGDGLKNYYNYLYHVKHDFSYFSFNGMHYPYGESVFLVDCHPFLATAIKFFSQNIVDVSDYALGIVNFLMLASLVVSSVFLFLIFKHFRFTWWIAISYGIAISFLTSNALLMTKGHYALTYGCAFPIGWYLLLQYESSPKKIYYASIICINTFFWLYTHTYLGLIIAAFAFFYHLFTYLSEKKWTTPTRFFAITTQVLLPLVTFYLILKLTDTHLGRIDLPFIYNYKASLYSVFLPNHSYLKPFYELFIDLSPQEAQRWVEIGNYIGLSTNLALIIIIAYLIYQLIIHQKWVGASLLSNQDFMMLLSAITLLLFAMAFPFQYDMDYLLPTPLKQFLALGRFAWPFYFVIIVFSFKALKVCLHKKWFNVVALISTALLLTEGFSNHFFIKEKITQHHNILNDIEYTEIINQNDFSDYQAILTVPFYHHYISLHSYEYSDHAEHISMALSYQSGKPLINAILSRPSVLESKAILQLFTPSFNQKPVLEKFTKQPILLVVSLKDPHSEYEQALIDKSKSIISTNNFELFKLSMDALADSETRKHVDEFLSRQSAYRLDEQSGYFYKNTPPLFYHSFDENTNNKTYRGNGAKAMLKNQFNVIYQSEALKLESNTEYNLSFWYYNYLYEQTFNTVWLELRDSTNTVYHSQYIDPSKTNFYDGNWGYSELNFTIKNSNDRIGLYTQGGKEFADSVFVDELLLREKSENHYKLTNSASNDTVIIKNNFTIPLH